LHLDGAPSKPLPSIPTGTRPLFATQEVSLKAVTFLSASASILGALFIMVGYAVLPELRSVTVYKLVLCLSVADLFSSITFILDAAAPVVTDGRVRPADPVTRHSPGPLYQTCQH
jgi:hypothetical protein